MMRKLLALFGSMLLIGLLSTKADTLLNIDFGGVAPGVPTELGKAAFGFSDNDFWNLVGNTSVSDLLLSDRTPSTMAIKVSGGPGLWGSNSKDSMLHTYIYPGTPNIEVLLTDLPSGFYDIYVYAHGEPPAENGRIQILSNDHDYGTQSTSDQLDWNPIQWTEGSQYVRFSNIQVGDDHKISVLSKPGVSGISVINGLQLVQHQQPTFIPVAGALLDVDFGITVPAPIIQTGPAAVGKNAGDYWNLYSRDGAGGSYLASGSLSDLKWSDGTVSTIDLGVTNAAGAWGTDYSEAMFHTYLYPLGNGGSIEVNLSRVPSGLYDVYVYAHGQPAQENGVISVSTSGHDYGTNSTSHGTDWAAPLYVEGKHYVVFHNVAVRDGGLMIQSDPGSSGLAVINGLQLVQAGTLPELAITKQPQGQRVNLGQSARFEVVARGNGPLSYQWALDGRNLAGATNSVLQIEAVSNSDAGLYTVLVSDAFSGIWSEGARLEVSGGFIPVAGALLDVDFGITVPAPIIQTGPAAVGKNAGDYWNLYSRDGAGGSYLASGSLSDLKWSDGTVSTIDLGVTNAAGAWGTDYSEAMFHTYLYPLGNGGSIEVNLSRVPSGLYDVYVYAHGQPAQENGVISVSTSGHDYGTNSTSHGTDWAAPLYVEGKHYVVFHNVAVRDGGLMIQSDPGSSGLAVINGLQLVQAGTLPELAITKQPQGQRVNLGQSARFEVVARGNGPLSYQWALDGRNLAGATNSVLQIEAVSNSDAGLYTVLVSDAFSGIWSEGARLEVSGGFIPVAGALLDVDFGITVPAPIIQTGPAAVGKNAGDYWNLYSRDGAGGSYLASGSLSDLKWSDGTVSTIDLGVTNAAGAWGTDYSEAMFHTYLYPLGNGGSIEVNLSQVPSGLYDVYVYAHGQPAQENGVISVSTSGHDYGTNSTSHGTDWAAPLYVEGKHYVVFHNVAVRDGGLMIQSDPGSSGLAVINGLQLVQIQEEIAPHFVRQPTNQTGPLGADMELAAKVEGSDPLAFVWYKNGNPLENSTRVTGADAAILTIHSLQEADAGTYTLVASNVVGVAKSDPAIVNVLPNVGPSSADLFDISQGTIVTAHSDLHPGFEAEAMIGGDKPSQEQGTLIFSDSEPEGTVHSIEWKTAAPVSLSSIRLYAAGSWDGGFNGSREFGKFTLKAKSSPTSPDYDVTIVSQDMTHPYTFVDESNRLLVAKSFDPIVSQYFRAEFVQWNVNLGADGPRVIELDGFGETEPKPTRTLQMGSVGAVAENTEVSVPIWLSSGGEVAGMTFDLGYEADYFGNPEVIWLANTFEGIVGQNIISSGTVRASFALPGGTVPKGTNKIAEIHFHARSIPHNLTSPLLLKVSDVYGATGEVLTTETEVRSGSIDLLARKFAGDNNANDELDVGDASIMLRFVNLLEPERAWDVTDNDLNDNKLLDLGDVIKVLRVVVGLDPQPGPLLKPQSLETLADGPEVKLEFDNEHPKAGDTVTVQVILNNNESAISGASFEINYPVNGLRLANAQSYKAGPLTASSELAALWNISPDQSNFETQNGHITVALSSAGDWIAKNGVLAELSFTVQPGFESQANWPVVISNLKLSDGFNLRTANSNEVHLAGREPSVSRMEGKLKSGVFELTLNVNPGTTYKIEVSDDLTSWVLLDTQTSIDGSITVKDNTIGEQNHRFYRATLVQ